MRCEYCGRVAGEHAGRSDIYHHEQCATRFDMEVEQKGRGLDPDLTRVSLAYIDAAERADAQEAREWRERTWSLADQYVRTRHHHIEMMAAAFVKQAGPGAVTDYELVEQREGLVTRWYFRPREPRG